MRARVIINADDFGLTEGVNRGIAELHRAGVLHSATLMATGRAFEDAVRIAHANPGLGVGCHVVLIDGVPVSAPESISSLIGPDGRSFRRSIGHFAAAVLAGRVAKAEIIREALAQVRRLQEAGIAVTHLDTHKHAHVFPRVCSALLDVARETSVGAIRNPFESSWSQGVGMGSKLRRGQIALLERFRDSFEQRPEIRNGEIHTTDGSVGIAATGNLDAQSLRELFRAMPAEGTWELVCHPGYRDDALEALPTRLRAQRETEMRALTEVVPALRTRQESPVLVNFRQLRDASNEDVPT